MNKIKTYLLTLLAGTVTFSVGLWLYSTKAPLTAFEYGVAGLVFLIVLISIVSGIKKLKAAKQGFPPEDELSLKIKQKAAAVTFSFSFVIWTLILLFMNDKELAPTIPIGLGIVITGVLFLVLWAYYSKEGLNDENTH